MRRVVALSLLGIFLLAAGCSKKSTTPEQKPPAEDYALQASQAIGADGGTIETDDFSLTVPEDAFGSDAELKLYASSTDRPFGDNGASRTFRLDGLPDEYSQPLRLSIKYQGTLSDSSFIALGEEAMVAGSGEMETAYQMLSATDSAGYLHCELPASDGDTLFHKRNYNQTLPGGDKGRKFVVASKYIKRLKGFADFSYSIYVPSGTAVDITHLVDLFDYAYQTFMDMGYPYFGQPADVIVKDLGTDDYCEFKYRNRDQYRCHEVNSQKMTQTEFPKLTLMIGREVYRCILFARFTDPYCPVMVGPAQQDYYWLNEAALSWCEAKFVPEAQQENYIPSCFAGNEMAPFNGMQVGIQSGEGDAVTRAKNHGCGMSAMMNFLVDRFPTDPADPTNTSVIGCIHGGLGMIQYYHPVQSVILCTARGEDSIKNWWWEFLKKYVQGGIYDVGSDVFTKEENISGVFDIESDKDTLAEFPGSYPDLSGKLYRINLKHKTIDENNKIVLKISSSLAAEDLKLVLFKFDGNALTFLKYGYLKVIVEKARQLTDEGVDLIAMVVNSSYHPPNYVTKSNINLEVKVVANYRFMCCFGFLGQMRKSYPDKPDEIYDNSSFVGCVWPQKEDELKGTKFELTWANEQQDDYLSSGTVSITLTEDHNRITRLDLSYELNWDDGSRRQVSLSMTDLEKSQDPLRPNSLYYALGGLGVCQHVNVEKHEYILSSGEEQKYVAGSCDCSSNPPLCGLEVWLEP